MSVSSLTTTAAFSPLWKCCVCTVLLFNSQVSLTDVYSGMCLVSWRWCDETATSRTIYPSCLLPSDPISPGHLLTTRVLITMRLLLLLIRLNNSSSSIPRTGMITASCPDHPPLPRHTLPSLWWGISLLGILFVVANLIQCKSTEGKVPYIISLPCAGCLTRKWDTHMARYQTVSSNYKVPPHTIKTAWIRLAVWRRHMLTAPGHATILHLTNILQAVPRKFGKFI